MEVDDLCKEAQWQQSDLILQNWFVVIDYQIGKTVAEKRRLVVADPNCLVGAYWVVACLVGVVVVASSFVVGRAAAPATAVPLVAVDLILYRTKRNDV